MATERWDYGGARQIIEVTSSGASREGQEGSYGSSGAGGDKGEGGRRADVSRSCWLLSLQA